MKRWMMAMILTLMLFAGPTGCTPSFEEQVGTFILDFSLQALAAWLF